MMTREQLRTSLFHSSHSLIYDSLSYSLHKVFSEDMCRTANGSLYVAKREVTIVRGDHCMKSISGINRVMDVFP